MKHIFDSIIKRGYWKYGNTVCGGGSTLEYTEPLRNTLPGFLTKHNITSMLDAPCGDYSWMQLVKFPEGFRYTGGDIVDSLIKNNLRDHPSIEFLNFDLTTTPIPDVDLLFCRDCLFHLSYNDIMQVLTNIARSNVKYILTTSYYSEYYSNKDIVTGDFRPISLLEMPYNLPDPIDSIDDWIPDHPARRLCLWAIETIRQRVNTL
jgi:hypothetical protein